MADRGFTRGSFAWFAKFQGDKYQRDVVAGGAPVAFPAIATTGGGTAAIALVKVGVQAATTTGGGTVLAALKKLGALLAALAGQSNLAAVLIDLESLSAITQGASSLAAQLNKIGIVSAGSAGEGDTNAQIGGQHLTLGALTDGSSSMSAEFESTGGSLPIAGYARRTRPRRPDWMLTKGSVRPLTLGTSGSSSVTAQLTLVPPDTFYEELAFVLLEAAA